MNLQGGDTLYKAYKFRLYPSSKMCSHCDHKTDKTNDLSVRNWVCDVCECENDRDLNASINIMFERLK